MASPLPVRMARQYVRATQSIKLNTPDGWMGTNGPVWWLGPDQWQPYAFDAYGWDNHYGGEPWAGQHIGGKGLLPAVTRATSIIVGPCIRTTWRYLSGTNQEISDIRGGTDLEKRPLWVADPQLLGKIPGGDGPRPTIPRPKRLGAHAFWETLLVHALWWGAGALMYTEDVLGQPLAGTLRIVNPTMWGFTDDGRFVIPTEDGWDDLISDEDGYFQVGTQRWRMVLLHGMAPLDGCTAAGALTRSGLVLTTGERMNSYLSNVLGSGVPSGVLKVTTPNFDKDKASALKESWMEAHGGTKKAVAVLNAGVDFTPLQLSVVDSDVVAAKGDWRVDMAHAFNLSAAYLDASTSGSGSITYANISDRRRDLLDHTLADWGRRLEDFITALLPYGQRMRVDWTGYLNTDPSRDLAFVKQGLAEGWLSLAEARDRMGLSPLAVDALPIREPGVPIPGAQPPELTEGDTGGDQTAARV